MMLLVLLFFTISISSSTTISTKDDPDQLLLPKFDRSHETVSVVVGKRALLPCYVSLPENSGGQFKIIWMRLNNSSILTMEDRAINGDPRISLIHAYADEWNLQIDDVDEDDAGIYRCVLNNGMYKTLTLDVKVPPQIIDDHTTEAYPPPIRSGSNFTLKCYAQGKPMPKIRILSYDQTDNAKIISDRNEVTLYNVSRHTRRRYECIASNGYPPDVARSFQLTIQYAPELALVVVSPSDGEYSSVIVFVDIGQNEVRLKCRISMNPFDKIYWTKNGIKLTNNHRHHQYVSTYVESHIIAELVLKHFTQENEGEYACVASNLYGTNSKSIQLLTTPTTTTITTTTTTTVVVTTSTNTLMEILTSRHINSRRKRPKHTRTTTPVQQRNSENLRVMTITSSSPSQALHHEYQMMTLFLLMISIAAYFR